MLDILAQDYDVALMNPPYGGGGKMPDVVQNYVRENYQYKANYYISFFEVCENIVTDSGRVGMLIPRSFLFKGRFTDFRTDFVGSKGGFDFL
ncbi:MAG: Eco57I restriction-modification methylase domain-containing protein, partial [Halobacteriaceae archaeon]